MYKVSLMNPSDLEDAYEIEKKTNLILKEIGIKRYSLRPKRTDFSKKNL